MFMSHDKGYMIKEQLRRDAQDQGSERVQSSPVFLGATLPPYLSVLISLEVPPALSSSCVYGGFLMWHN
jgi:hypothetical protein